MKCENVHGHERSAEPSGLPEPLKKRVLDMSGQGITPKRIHITFQNEKLAPLPRLEQIQWLVNRHRTAKCEPFTDLQLREYCEANSLEPDDEDKWFVLAHEILSPESFFVIWTTKKLLKRQLSSEQIQCDATSSTNWHNFPLTVVGHSDLNRHFTPTLVAVGHSEDKYVYGAVFRVLSDLGYRPQEVLGDGAGSITSAAKQHFAGAVRIMCAVHVLRRVDIHKKSLQKDTQEKVKTDVLLLQQARSNIEFQRLAQNLVEKWREIPDDGIEKFGDYFLTQWGNSDVNIWCEGVSNNCVHNNGVESTNNAFKRDHTFRRMDAFSVFFKKVDEFIGYESARMKASSNELPKAPAIPHKIFKEAYELEKFLKPDAEKKRLAIRLKGTRNYIISSGKATFADSKELFAAYRRLFFDGPATCDEYARTRFSVYLVQRVSRFGEDFYTCSCWNGSKKQPCKHAAMVACSMEQIQSYPEDVTAQTMKPNRKRSHKKSAGRDPLVPAQNRFSAAD